MIQSRKAKRKPFDHACLLDLLDGNEPVPCVLSDISDSGARIDLFQSTADIPDCVTLILSPAGNVKRQCEVVWRSPTQIGVKFRKGC